MGFMTGWTVSGFGRGWSLISAIKLQPIIYQTSLN